MRHGRDEIRAAQRPTLMRGNRDEGRFVEFAEQRRQLGKDRAFRASSSPAGAERPRNIGKCMWSVWKCRMSKSVDTLTHVLEPQYVERGESDRGPAPAARTEARSRTSSRRGFGAAARKQRHLMALAHQLFGEIGNDPLCAPIERGRHAFHEWEICAFFIRNPIWPANNQTPRAASSSWSPPAKATTAEISQHRKT